MSRSGYNDDCENWELIRWRGAVTSAIRGRRGQSFLKEMLAALDALPEKVLIANQLQDNEGGVCAIGAVGARRGIDMSTIDPEERDVVAKAFGISAALAAEIAFENDEGDWHNETPHQRWTRVRAWVTERIANENSKANQGHEGSS